MERTRYEVRQSGCAGCSFGAEGYSKYYSGKFKYGKKQAIEHCHELRSRKQKVYVVKIVEITTIVYGNSGS